MTSTGTCHRQHRKRHVSLAKLHPRFTRKAMHSGLQLWWVELQLAVFRGSLKAGCQSIPGTFAQHRVHLQGLSGTALLCCTCGWLLEGPVEQSMNKTVLYITQMYFYLWRMRQEHEPELCGALHPSCLPKHYHSCIFITPDQVQWC